MECFICSYQTKCWLEDNLEWIFFQSIKIESQVVNTILIDMHWIMESSISIKLIKFLSTAEDFQHLLKLYQLMPFVQILLGKPFDRVLLGFNVLSFSFYNVCLKDDLQDLQIKLKLNSCLQHELSIFIYTHTYYHKKMYKK